MPEATPEHYQAEVEGQKLMGALPPKMDPRNLMTLRYMDTSKSPPPEYDYEKRFKSKFSPYRGQTMGSCTISSQAEYTRRIEYPRRFGRDLYIPDDMVDNRYIDLSNRLYGGGDNGAYELDAVKDFVSGGFRNVQATKRSKWTYKIDGFAGVNPLDIETLKIAIATFKVIKICFAVHANMYHSSPTSVVVWDPNSPIVGYHSMITDGYSDSVRTIFVPHTWSRPRQEFSYDYVLNAATEAYTLIDAKNIKEDPQMSKMFDIKAFNKDLKEVKASEEPANIVADPKWAPIAQPQ